MNRLLYTTACALVLCSTEAAAQSASGVPAGAAQAGGSTGTPAPAAPSDDIVVTATRRPERLADVPIAVSVLSGRDAELTGATDIRQLAQIAPSLSVTSSVSEAGGAVARIRGIGTVGDNPGLEGAVAVFIDGVYRSRAGVGLTELGAIDRVEVLRGPQGTLFGRNASAGLINVLTKAPSKDFGAEAELSAGNYDYRRVAVGITGPVTGDLSARVDGIAVRRDGFVKDVVSGRRFNDRDRYLLRGQLLYEPGSDLSIRLIGDFSDRDEQCCAAPYAPTRNLARSVTGDLVATPSSVAALIRGLGGTLAGDTGLRETAVTPGRDYRSDVRDWGVSGQVDWTLGVGRLTSITAYRDWALDRRQDSDFNSLDLLHYDHWKQSFRTFSQELRLQGSAFDDRLDYLVGGYYAHENLSLDNGLRYGADYQRFANCLLFASLAPAAVAPGAPGCIAPAAVPGLPAALRAVPGNPGFGSLAAALGRPGSTLAGAGVVGDSFRQRSENWAVFTHEKIELVRGLELTLGARYTHETKDLDATLLSDNPLCALALAAAPTLAQLPCVGSVSSTVDGTYAGRRSDGEWTGTASLAYKVTPRLLAYGGFSRGYKSGGFNIDRAAIGVTAAPAAVNGVRSADFLTFDPEKVDAYEVGVKFDGRAFDVSVAAFREAFANFQLNAYTGLGYVVENIQSCATSLGGGDRDLSGATGACAGKTRAGVISQGVEVEATARPSKRLTAVAGFTLADTHYRNELVGRGGAPLTGALFQLPGRRLSNAPLYTVTTSLTYQRPLGSSGLSGLAYIDARYQSDVNTGSDLDFEKGQDGYVVVNARVGIAGKGGRWGLEVWSQNLLNQYYTQVAFDAPAQGAGTVRAVQQGLLPTSTALFNRFLGEPRTFGLTLRGRY